MKKTLLIAFASIVGFTGFSQCLDDHNWDGAEFGVSPDPELGETFVDGVLNTPYAETIFVLVPNTIAGNSVDSLVLGEVTAVQDGTTYSLADLGLTIECNNGGVNTNPCTFSGGQSGCNLLSGTPLMSGEFDVTILATGYGSLLGNPLSVPYNYEGFTLTIQEDTSIPELTDPIAEVTVTPNPFTTKASVEFQALNAGQGTFKIFSLLGEEKVNEKVQIGRGLNKLLINSNELAGGVYLYHIEFNDFKVTKRLVVNK